MCGIFGIFGKDASTYSENLLLECAGFIKHRGPDFTGLYNSNFFRGASVRLSIIDLDSGNQPITTNDGRFTIIFNGEIYNYKELFYQLQQKGVQFKTKSDTEVLLQMYVHEGRSMLDKLEGQFAFIIYDSLKKELFGARDRWGICPFYYTRLPNETYAIASEIKAFFPIPNYKYELKCLGIQQIAWSWANIPPGTVWENIYELPIGHYLILKLGKEPEYGRYFNIMNDTGKSDFNNITDAIYGIRELLIKETEKHMIADVPVGAYLSGGIDSSVLVNIACNLSKKPLHTFSVSFEDKEFDESIAQKELVDKWNLQHTELKISKRDIVENFPKVVFHAEKPLFRNAPIPLFLLSKKVQEAGLKVVLTGEGSDEVFWGYDTYRELIIRRLWARNVNSEWRPSLFSKIFPYFSQYQDKKTFAFLKLFYKKTLENIDHPLYPMLPRLENGWAVNQFIKPELLTDKQQLESLLINAMQSGIGQSQEISQLKICQAIELQTLLPGYLLSTQGDRMLTAHSIEGRFPYLGVSLVKELWKLPDSWKIKGLKDKIILREAFKGVIPETIRTRPKFAYRAPDISAFFPNPPRYVEYLLSKEYTKKVGIFLPEVVETFFLKLKKYREGQPVSMKDNVSFIWILSTHMLFYFYSEKNSYCDLEI